MLKQGCRDAVTWPSNLTVAINLSVVQFRNPALALSVVSALGQSGLAASRLELEITETVLLQDDRATAEGVETEQQLEILKAEGCMQVQGYLFSRPKPATEIPALLRQLQTCVRAA